MSLRVFISIYSGGVEKNENFLASLSLSLSFVQ